MKVDTSSHKISGGGEGEEFWKVLFKYVYYCNPQRYLEVRIQKSWEKCAYPYVLNTFSTLNIIISRYNNTAMRRVSITHLVGIYFGMIWFNNFLYFEFEWTAVQNKQCVLDFRIRLQSRVNFNIIYSFHASLLRLSVYNDCYSYLIIESVSLHLWYNYLFMFLIR